MYQDIIETTLSIIEFLIDKYLGLIKNKLGLDNSSNINLSKLSSYKT